MSSPLLTPDDTIERICHLFSERNAEDHQTITFWQQKILLYCITSKSLTFKPNDILNAFTIQGIYPTSFNKCLEILKQRNGVIMNKTAISIGKLNVQQYMFATAYNFTKKLLTTEDKNSEELVCVECLQHTVTFLLKYVRTLRDCDCITKLHLENGVIDPALEFDFTFQGLISKAGKANPSLNNILGGLSENDILMLADYLVSTKKAVLSEDGSLIKVLKQQPASSSGIFSVLGVGGSVCQIDEGETAVLRLRVSMAQLEFKAGQLEEKAEEHRRLAVKHKGAGNQNAALLQLSLRRNALQTRDRLAASLHSLNEAYERIDSSGINKIITDAYRAAAVGLRESRKQSGVDVQGVEDAMDAFQHEMDEMSDISTALEGGAMALSEEEEDALQSELAELMACASLSDRSVPSSTFSQLQQTEASPSTSAKVLSSSVAPLPSASEVVKREAVVL